MPSDASFEFANRRYATRQPAYRQSRWGPRCDEVSDFPVGPNFGKRHDAHFMRTSEPRAGGDSTRWRCGNEIRDTDGVEVAGHNASPLIQFEVEATGPVKKNDLEFFLEVRSFQVDLARRRNF